MMCRDPAGCPLPPEACVFGNEIGQPLRTFKRAWQRVVLRAHGVTPTYAKRVKVEGKAPVRTAALSPECRVQLRAINLHFHDLRRQAGSR